MAINISKSVGLNATNNAEDVVAVKTRLIELGFDWLDPDSVAGPVTVKTIKLFQAIKNGFNRVGDPRNDGRIDVGGDTLKWLQAANAPRWQLMPAGSGDEGFVNHNIAQLSDQHDFGTSWLAQAIRDTGARYKATYLASHPDAALLTINDVSLPRGGDTPMHATHESGLACDIRLPRKDGSVGGTTVLETSVYDRKAMRAILKAFRQHDLASRVLLSDQQLVSEGLCIAAQGHLNHAHFEIKPPVRVMG